MSAKLLYTLSDDNQNLGKQIGCMNGFLHFLDRRHFIISRTIHRRLPSGEGNDRQRDGNAAGKRSKEKHHHNVSKQVRRNNVEPSGASISSSTGSTTMSSSEYDSTIRSERSPFYETTSSETNSWDSKVHQPLFSPYRSNPSPIVTPKRQPMTNQLDSPRIPHLSKLDSSRPTSLNESFRSISSNQSAPVTPRRKKDASRMSYDGTETREKYVTGSKFGDLPRLSLDSRQRAINKSISESRKDLHLTDQPEEPGSYRPPSNIVVKLMGLENLPDYTPTHKNHIESDRFSSCGRFDSLSKSSRTIDESQVIKVSDSPRNNSKESVTPRLKKEPTARKNKDGYPDCGKTAAKCREVQPKSPNQSLTLYGEIERQLADLDFKKSGKDLRALKQILEAIHREKTMNKARKENHSSGCLADMSNNNIRQTKSPCKGQMLQKLQVSRHPQDIKSRTTKSAKPVRDSAKGGAFNIHNVSLPRLNQQRCDQPADNVLYSVDEKATKTYCSQEPISQTQSTTSRDLRERTHRPIRTSKAAEHETKGTFTRSVRISETGSMRMYRRNRMSENQSHAPVTTLITRTKQHSQQTVGSRPQNQKLQSKSSSVQNSNVGFSDFTADIACLSQQRNSRFLMINNGSFYQADIKNPERIKGDQSFAELPIDVKEQPSPVSVLDAKFYGDESPSPVKKKLTAFSADDDSTSTNTENELKDIDIIDSPYSIRLGFSCDSDDQRQEKFMQSGHAPRQLSSNQGGNATTSMTPQKDIKLEMEYVRDILLASGLLDDPNFIEVNLSVYQSKGNRLLSHDKARSKTMNRPYDKHRRLIFDVVNEILTNKLPSIVRMGHQPQLLLNRLSGFKNDQKLLQEILKDVDGLQTNSFRQSVDDEETFLTSIIEEDLMHRSANWTDSNSEISGLVLDIERLIFKDLIGEVVYGEASHIQAQK